VSDPRQAEGDREIITGEHIRAARKLLSWSRLTLALEANVAPSTEIRERGSRPSVLCVSTIKRTLEGAGVEFTEFEPGVKLTAKPAVTRAT
jgi:transcriptional regulator with XRE-family HTH domain